MYREVYVITQDRFNNPSRSHLYLLVDHEIDDNELYCGLSHVTEHACLIDKTSGKPDHFRGGYTCLSHIGLYFETEKHSHWLDEVVRRLFSPKATTKKNVERAKREVIIEAELFRDRTSLNEKIVRFVTEDRISRFAMGTPSQIEKITFDDVTSFWNSILRDCGIYVFRFKTANEIYTSFQSAYSKKRILDYSNDVHHAINNRSDCFLLLTKEKNCVLEVYLPYPCLSSGAEYLHMAFAEHSFLKLLEKRYHRKAKITEKYFNKSERYLVATIYDVQIDDTYKIIAEMRECLNVDISITQLQRDFDEFVNDICSAMKNESALDVLNKCENWILYGKPIFNVSAIKEIEFNYIQLLTMLQSAYSRPLKIVIKDNPRR